MRVLLGCDLGLVGRGCLGREDWSFVLSQSFDQAFRGGGTGSGFCGKQDIVSMVVVLLPLFLVLLLLLCIKSLSPSTLWTEVFSSLLFVLFLQRFSRSLASESVSLPQPCTLFS